LKKLPARPQIVIRDHRDIRKRMDKHFDQENALLSKSDKRKLKKQEKSKQKAARTDNSRKRTALCASLHSDSSPNKKQKPNTTRMLCSKSTIYSN
jgi:hypothetical protein